MSKYNVTPVHTKWVDTDTAFEGEPLQIRSRTVAREFKSGDKPDLQIGTPPRESLNAIISVAVSHSLEFSPPMDCPTFNRSPTFLFDLRLRYRLRLCLYLNVQQTLAHNCSQVSPCLTIGFLILVGFVGSLHCFPATSEPNSFIQLSLTEIFREGRGDAKLSPILQFQSRQLSGYIKLGVCRNG